MDPVGRTSRWMAAARARESERADRLFDDPLAAALAGPEGFAWLDRIEPVSLPGTPGAGLGPGLYVTVRTCFFDDFLLGASRSIGTRQVVLVAAGMDARAFRLDWPPGTRLYELNRPEVLFAKDAVASALQKTCTSTSFRTPYIEIGDQCWTLSVCARCISPTSFSPATSQPHWSTD